MNPLDRIRRYIRAYTGLRKLNRTTASLLESPAEMIAQTFHYSGEFLQPIQVEEELASLLEDVRSLDPRTVVEIGTSMGGPCTSGLGWRDPTQSSSASTYPVGNSVAVIRRFVLLFIAVLCASVKSYI